MMVVNDVKAAFRPMNAGHNMLEPLTFRYSPKPRRFFLHLGHAHAYLCRAQLGEGDQVRDGRADLKGYHANSLKQKSRGFSAPALIIRFLAARIFYFRGALASGAKCLHRV